MWSPDRLNRRAALLGLLALGAVSACGLTPVYGPNGAGNRLFGKVRARDPKSYQDFAFNSRLTERLGDDSAAIYTLQYQLNVGVVPQAITRDQVTTRYALNGTADFALTDSQGTALTQGRVSAFSSYSTSGTTIATLTADGDARSRLALMLADQVVTRLLAAASTLPE